MMTTTNSTVRIFISSPGDVNDERDKARRVIDGLQRHYTGVTLQPVLWQDLALPATASFQETIDVILQQKPIEIAVFILWSRLGSPLGPAITRPDGTQYRSGTEREFDLMLAAFAQSGQKRPVILAYTRDDEGGFRQSLADCPAARLVELIAQRKLAESFIREQFKDTEGHNLRAYHSYREPVSFAQRLHTHLRQVLDELLGVDAAPRWPDVPYRGLAFFDVAHAAIFHGRDEETCDLLQRLRDQERAGCAFAVIVGASGSGKSSLARAGVAAFLTRHSFEDDVKEWRAAVFIPGLSGNDLWMGLVRILAEQLPELRGSDSALDDIAGGLYREAELTAKLSITPAFTRAAGKGPGAVRVLLVLDQLEELWTDRRITAEQRERFFAAIEALARCGPIDVLATLRSDFYPHAQRDPTFLRLKGERGHYDLLPPGAAALQRLIVEPARLAGLRFERDERTGKTLDEIILQDASHDPSALPLLQYALSELYHGRDETSRTLTFAAYEKLGGVEGALGRRASDTFNSLPEDARAALPEILPLLVTVDIAGEQTAARRRAPLSDLMATPGRRALAESLIAARFLSTDRQDDTAIASLAHEALLRRWEHLAAWVAANSEHLRLRARAEQNQQRWEQQGRDPSLLLTPGLPLEEGRQLLSNAPQLLSTRTVDYIRASIAQDELEQSSKRRRRRVIMAAMSVLTALAFIGGAVGWIKQREAERRGEENAQLAKRETEARALADTHAQTAREEAEQARRNLYVARMNLAQAAWEHALIRRVRELLDEYQPQPGVEDQRGFEWHYWDRQCRSELLELKGRPFAITRLAFSPDGTRLAAASLNPRDGTVQVWDAKNGQKVVTLSRNISGVTCMAFSPDGKQLASGSTRDVKVWDVTSGLEVFTLKGHIGHLMSVAFSPDGKRLVSGGWDQAIKVWDVANGQELMTLEGHTEEVAIVAFSADGKHLISASETMTVKVWDAASGQETLSLKGDAEGVTSVALSPDGKRLASASRENLENTVSIWDATSGQETLTLKGHDGEVDSVAFSPDGNRLASSSLDRTVKVWDVLSGQVMLTLKGHSSGVQGVAFSPDGKRLATASYQTVKIWDSTIGQQTFTLSGESHEAMSVAFHPNAEILASVGSDGTVKMWDAASGRETMKLMGHTGEAQSVAFSPDGKRLATAGLDQTVKLWDATSGMELLTWAGHTQPVQILTFSPDGERLISASDDLTVRMWDAARGQKTVTLKGHEGRVTSMALSQDGKKLASVGLPYDSNGRRLTTVSDDLGVQVWDVTIGQELFRLTGHLHEITSLAFSPDGKRLASGSYQTITIWDVTRGRELLTLTGHTDGVQSLVFSPDGKRLASASVRKIKIWDAANGIELLTLTERKGDVRTLSFCAAGQRLASVSSDGTVKVWDARPWTPELHAEREALGVIHFWQNQGKAKSDWPDAIRSDPILSEPVRDRALQFAREWR